MLAKEILPAMIWNMSGGMVIRDENSAKMMYTIVEGEVGYGTGSFGDGLDIRSVVCVPSSTHYGGRSGRDQKESTSQSTEESQQYN